ncbi:MAG TPA: DUF4375 domain-containing protein [Gemmataceae bacterium]|nr:DUF4375 domain-containing protein [Gemmataceae bacterium]
MTEEQLDEAIHEYAMRETEVDFRDWTTAIMRLPPSVRVYYFSWLLEREVCNGGFIHFFLNFWGRLGNEGASCFEALGSPELAAVIQRAVVIFWTEIESGKYVDKEGYEVELAVDPLLRHMDDEFYRLRQEVDTDRLRRNYLREHSAELMSCLANERQS